MTTADARLVKYALHPDCSTVEADILGHDVTYKLGAPGRHVVHNSLAVLGRGGAGRRRSGARGAGACRARPAQGPRQRASSLNLPGGEALADRRKLQRQSGLDARRARAARPRARSARMAAVSRSSATCSNLGRRARRCTPALPEPVNANGIDLVFCCGPLMRSLVAGPSLRAAAAAMRMTPRRSKRRSCRRSVPATPSWSRGRSARAWGPSSRRSNGSTLGIGRREDAHAQG